MRGELLLAAVVLLALAGCAPTAVTPAAAAPASPEAQAAPAMAPTPASPSGTSAASEGNPGAPPAAPSLACRSDADCAVKDVGSCCGYRPACVNADAETFPEQVKARCAAEGRMGICGFQPVSGCQCVAGQCAARPETIGPAPPKALQ